MKQGDKICRFHEAKISAAGTSPLNLISSLLLTRL